MVLACCAGAALAQGTAVVEGYVRDRRGNAIPDTVVVLKTASGMQVDRASTNRDGHYIFFQLGAGTYIISVEPKPPQEAETRMVEFLPGDNDGHRREDFFIDRPLQMLAAAVSSEPVFHQDVPSQAKQAYDTAIERLRLGRVEEGLAGLERAVDVFPNYFLALNRLGMEYLQLGDAAKTGQWCQRAVAVNRNSASSFFGLGWAFYQIEKLDEAAKALSEAAKLNPKASETHWYAGMTSIELKRWPAAEQSFQSYLKLNERNDRPMVHLYLTSVYDQLGRYDAAVLSLETYLKSVPPKERTQKLRDLLAQLQRKRNQARN